MNLLSKYIALTVLCVSPLASAQSKPSASTTQYAVTFNKIVDSCDGKGLKLQSASMAVSQAGDTLSIVIPDLATLTGKVGRRGKLRASSSREFKSKGLRARFGINGRVTGNSLRAVFTAEYFKLDKTPLCTQSFSVSGKSS
ncbi:MAG: hypothetical protein JKY56_21575 [Kofleriaceae bacterium]|nr:hypothetical protein [Kofleriaceae bacterium]